MYYWHTPAVVQETVTEAVVEPVPQVGVPVIAPARQVAPARAKVQPLPVAGQVIVVPKHVGSIEVHGVPIGNPRSSATGKPELVRPEKVLSS